MEITGKQIIGAPQKVVWDALNDVAILQACVPGCESIEQDSPTDFRGVMAAKVGPISAKFKGKLTITRSDPPNSYSLMFEGQGGVAGFAKGTADVSLRPEGSGTELTYVAQAQIGGKIAQIGSRLVDLAAKKITEEFFSAFQRRLSGESDVSPVVGVISKPAASIERAQPVAANSSQRVIAGQLIPWLIAAVATVAAILGWMR